MREQFEPDHGEPAGGEEREAAGHDGAIDLLCTPPVIEVVGPVVSTDSLRVILVPRNSNK